MQNIIVLSGGTGGSQILYGLKDYECDITAVVNICDNGGHSGEMRSSFGVLPPGDLRQCMVSLAGNNSEQLRRLFKYRFPDRQSFGNMFITASSDVLGGTLEGINFVSSLLSLKGKVLPASLDDAVLIAETENGEILNGQLQVSYPEKDTKIQNLYYKKKVFLLREAGEAIRKADKIVICPGDLYGSVLPLFLIDGMKEALSEAQESTASVIYVTNLVTKEGSYNFKTSDFVREVERYSGVSLDHIIINQTPITSDVLEKYKMEHSKPVLDDFKKNDPKVIRANISGIYPQEEKTILRHNPQKIGRVIMEI